MESQPSAEQRLQSAVAELKIFEEYYSELGTREAILVQGVAEARGAQEALNGLPKDGSAEILSPIGGGVMVPVTYDSGKKLLLNIGASIVIEALPEIASKYLEGKIAELDRAISTLRGQREELLARINSLKNQISRMLQGVGAAAGR